MKKLITKSSFITKTKKAKQEILFSKDEANIKAWGVLQFYRRIKKGENGQEKATLLKLYSKRPGI